MKDFIVIVHSKRIRRKDRKSVMHSKIIVYGRLKNTDDRIFRMKGIKKILNKIPLKIIEKDIEWLKLNDDITNIEIYGRLKRENWPCFLSRI